MPIVPDLRAWLRRTVPWSNSAAAWRERLGLAAWLVAVVLWWRWLAAGSYVLGPLQLAGATGLVLTVAVLARRGWLRLFGPVLFYEILRNARRGRYFLLRWLYAVSLLLLLLWVHAMWSLDVGVRQGVAKVDYKMQAELAWDFFKWFAGTQFAIVVALTPAYVAGAIAEDKENKTLEFLLATDLHSREIVCGKLVARLGNLALFLLTGLPVLSLMQFFGGIDPGLLLATFAVTALTGLSLAGLGILNSVFRRRARDAIVLTYLAAVLYVVIASLSLTLPFLVAHYRTVTNRLVTPYVWENALDEVVKVVNYGNPVKALIDIESTIDSGGVLADTLADVMERYTLFHGVMALVCVAWAVMRLRAIALAQAGGPVQSKVRNVLARRRPPVGERPMVWKEVRVEGGLRFGWMGRVLIGLLVGGSFVPLIILFYVTFFDGQDRFIYNREKWYQFGQNANYWVRSINVLVSVLMLLGVAVRAAGSVCGERDRDTLVSLMGTPLTTQEILWGKWWGSLFSVRLFLVWLGAVWALGLVSGAVSLLAVLLQVVAMLPPAACLASLGLYFSSTGQTTLCATTWTLMMAVFAVGGHWLATVMGCYFPLMVLMRGGDNDMMYAVNFEMGLTPPVVAAWAPFRELGDLSLFGDRFPGFAVLGMFVWCVAAAALGSMAHERFRRLTHRDVWVPASEPAARGEEQRSTRGLTEQP